MQEKLAIINSKRVGKQNTLLAKKCSVRSVRSVSLNIWRVKRYVCFWPLWFTKSTILRVCFSLLVLSSHISVINIPIFPCCSLSSKIRARAYI